MLFVCALKIMKIIGIIVKRERNMYPILDTRVECKVVTLHKQIIINIIRIKPDWNVKLA